MGKVTFVIPCFNEARRLQPAGFRTLLSDDRVQLIFVDDGSTDGTGQVLTALCRDLGPRSQTLRLGQNRGKGEAVRRGLSLGIESGSDAVGFLDADLEIPPTEALRLVTTLFDGTADGVLASRVHLPFKHMDRAPIRSWLGRAFAMSASVALREKIYDTQCGAKVFRTSEALTDALREPFRSRWIFDVELLGRLLTHPSGPAHIVELPLRKWHAVGDSRLSATAMIAAGFELAWVARDLASLRSSAQQRRPENDSGRVARRASATHGQRKSREQDKTERGRASLGRAH